MEEITKFKAKDGKEFVNKDECVKYELLIDEVNTVMSTLPNKPENDGCEFANGNGYLQHDPKIFNEVKINLLKIAARYIDHKWIRQMMEEPSLHPSWVGRLISNYDIEPLGRAWYRVQCVDPALREWGQPYYANNKGGAEICLNR